jgi:hypothetical protein
MTAPRPALGIAALGLLALGAAIGLGCAAIPPPEVLGELERIRVAPAAVQARVDAPTAYDRAELLRLEAQDALERGDFAAAQITGERARTAYDVAVALGRLARAEQAEVTASAEATEAAKQLAAMDADHERLAADMAALELRLQALREASALPSDSSPSGSKKGSPEAVAAFHLQARLLCTAARLLWLERPASSASAKAGEALGALETELGADRAALSIEQAVALRAACLGQLTLARRASPTPAVAGMADELLDELSATGWGVVTRDERGVVLTARQLFDGEALGKGVAQRLASVAELARKHASFPLLLVLHESTASGPGQREIGQRRGKALARALGHEDARIELAGTAEPTVDPAGKYRAGNERVEIVFVTPGPP